MNRKQFALLVFLVVVVGLAGVLVYNKENNLSNEGDPTVGKKLLGDFPINDVAHIALKQGTNELNLVKKDDLWRVRERHDYPANFSQISGFLIKARDLKIGQSDKVGPSNLARFGLVEGKGTNSAMEVDFKDQKEKAIRTLLVGKQHMRKSDRPSPYGDASSDNGWPDGRYVKVGSSGRVDLISDALSELKLEPQQWLNKDFFKVEKARSIDVSFPAATNSWKLTRETATGQWKLADAKPNEKLDSSKISSLSNPLGYPSFNDVETPDQAKKLGLDKPTVITLNTFDNFTYTLKVGQKTKDSYPLALTVTADLPKERTAGKDEKPADKARLDKEFKDNQKKLEDKLAQEERCEKWVYLVSSWTLDPVLKERSQLLEGKKEEKAASATTAAQAKPFAPVSLPGQPK